MIEISPDDFIGRVFTARELVKFTMCDPFAHMGAAQYVELMVNQRSEAPERLVGFEVHKYVMDPGIGFAIVGINIQFVRPCRVGDWLEIASWVTSRDKVGFKTNFVFVGEEDRRCRAISRNSYCPIHVKSGKLADMPTVYPSKFDENRLPTLPMAKDYLGTIKGLPRDFGAEY